MRLSKNHPLYKKFAAQIGLKAPHKYKANKTTIDGISFPSKLEADTYAALLMYQKLGIIRDLSMQDPVEFYIFLGEETQKKKRRCFKIDFKAFHNERNEEVWFEAKGMRTKHWRECEELWRLEGPGPLFLVTACHYRGYGKGKEICLPERPWIIPAEA